jgi:hypothetical protein
MNVQSQAVGMCSQMQNVAQVYLQSVLSNFLRQLRTVSLRLQSMSFEWVLGLIVYVGNLSFSL